MKKLSLFAIITLGTLFAFGPMIHAAEKAEGARQQRRGSRPDQIQLMKKELNLTESQVEKLKPILQAEGKKMREVWQDSNLSREEKRTKMQSMRKDMLAKIKPILSQEQLEKWEKLMKERRQRRQRK